MHRTWEFGTNKLYNIGSLHCVYQPTWLAVVGWFINVVIDKGCAIFSKIPMPFGNRIKVNRDGYTYTWNEYYGDFGCLYHIYICSPAMQWYWMHPKRKSINIELGYDRLKELFYHIEREHFDFHEETSDYDGEDGTIEENDHSHGSSD